MLHYTSVEYGHEVICIVPFGLIAGAPQNRIRSSYARQPYLRRCYTRCWVSTGRTSVSQSKPTAAVATSLRLQVAPGQAAATCLKSAGTLYLVAIDNRTKASLSRHATCSSANTEPCKPLTRRPYVQQRPDSFQ